MEKLLFECDICHKQQVANVPPRDWDEITYSYGTDKNGENKAISYHVCSPACYFKMITKCVDQAAAHMAVTIQDMPLPFARKLIEYVNSNEIVKSNEDLITIGEPQPHRKTIVKTTVLNKREFNQLKREKILPQENVEKRKVGRPRKERTPSDPGKWTKITSKSGKTYYRKTVDVEKAKSNSEQKNDMNEIRTMEVDSQPINIHADKAPSVEEEPKLTIKAIIIETIYTREKKIWLELLMREYKNDLVMQEMRDVWGQDRRWDSGLVDKLEMPSVPYLRYDDRYVCFVPKSLHYSFAAKIKDYLPTNAKTTSLTMV